MPDFVIGTDRPACPFCDLGEREILARNESSIAFYDGYPVSKGHTLVISRQHTEHYFEMTELEKQSIWKLVDEVIAHLRESFRPDGFNVGFNAQAAAGQTVFHTHVHVIPRYAGDVENPRGGIRHVIPGKGNY